MKRPLKLFLVLCVLLVAVYATTPVWLPGLLARQIPPGWQLEELQSGYPGLAGINIHSMSVTGELGATDISLNSSDLRFTYRGLRTDIRQASLDVVLRTDGNRSDDALTLDDLVLPVTNLTGKLPMVSVRQVNLALYLENGLQPVTGRPARPLLFELHNLRLIPRDDQSFHLDSEVIIAEPTRPVGRLDADVAPGASDVSIRFPSDPDQPAWLSLEIKQEGTAAETLTRAQAILDTGLANRDWPESLLPGYSRQVLSSLEGELALEAVFSGRGLQRIQHASMSTTDLQLLTSEGKLHLDTDLLARRKDQNIAITLTRPARFIYQGDAGWINEILSGLVSGLQLPARPGTTINTMIDSSSSLEVLPASTPAIRFNGDIKVDLNSDEEQLKLESNGLQIVVENIFNPDSIAADGLFKIDWELSAPVSYLKDNVRLDVAELSISADLLANDGGFTSNGGGNFMQARLASQSVFSEEVEMSWQDLDLINLNGKLTTLTHGLTAQFEDKTWEDFNLDVNYTLLNGPDINGAGTVIFASGTEFPVQFEANTQAQRWKVKLMQKRLPITDLRKLLSAVHYELPSSVKLTDGFIELQGDVEHARNFSASMKIAGTGLGASMHKSRASDASFSLNAGYNNGIWVRGPVSVSTFNLAGGIGLANFRTTFEAEGSDRVVLKNLYAELFGGKLELGSLSVSENSIEDATLEFSHIDLEMLLDYADIDGLEGTGFLDIILPVNSDQASIRIENGTFTSTVPGRLAYTKEGVAGSNIGLQALENFEYKGLSGTLNYQSDGTYLMTIRLEGKNPELYGGHPVIFNLNINGLLPAFFEAMFKTGSFEEAILKEINAR